MNRPGFPWFKMYAEARTDKKLGLLSMAERGCWLNLICYASEQETRGTFDASDCEMLALECADGDEELLSSTIAKLLKIKHLVRVTTDVTSETSSNDYMTLQFRTFDARQAQKVSNFPSDAKERVSERVRKHRALKGNVTSETTRNGRNDTDRDREEEKKRVTGNSSVLSDGESFIQSNVVVNPSLITKSEDVSTATPSLKILPAPEPDDITRHENNVSELASMEERITAQQVAKKYNLPIMQGGYKNALLLELVDILRPYKHLSREWLVQQAAAHAAYLRRENRNYEHRLLINWINREISRNEALKDVQRQQLEKSMSNGQHTTGPETGQSQQPKSPSDADIRYEYHRSRLVSSE